MMSIVVAACTGTAVVVAQPVGLCLLMFSWTTHNVVLQAMQNSPGVEEVQEGSVNKVEAAEAEVAELQRRVECERQAFAQVSANLIASTSHFDLKVRFYMPKCPLHLKLNLQTRRMAWRVSARGLDLPLLHTLPIAACRSVRPCQSCMRL